MSKLGVHVSAGNRRGFGSFLQRAAVAGNPVPVVLSVDQDVWPDISAFSPSTKLIFRHQPRTYNGVRHDSGLDAPPDMYKGNAVVVAHNWMDAIMPEWRRNKAHYYAPINEQDAATLADFGWLNDFTVECMGIAGENGFSLALYGFSSGNPKHLLNPAGEVVARPEQCWLELVPSLKYAKQNGHILILHEYGFDSPAANGGPATSLRASAPHLALRYRSAYQFLNQFDACPPLVIGEAGAGVGGFSVLGREAWLEDAKWYDRELMRDGVVLGACLYQIGGAENIKDAIDALTVYVASTPTPMPEAWPVVGEVEQPPVYPPLKYARTYYLLHPSQYTPGWLAPALRADRMWTVGASPHDAFIDAPELTGRRVIAINPQLWQSDENQPTLAEWAKRYFTGYELIGITTETPVMLEKLLGINGL